MNMSLHRGSQSGLSGQRLAVRITAASLTRRKVPRRQTGAYFILEQLLLRVRVRQEVDFLDDVEERLGATCFVGDAFGGFVSRSN